VAVPGSSAMGASLAKRLRELRLSGFPGGGLTQAKLAGALSQDEAVAASTLSSWENADAPALPPPTRLRAYALFFATERSLEGGPHLLQADQLDPAEEQRRHALEQELLRLREADADGSGSARQFWCLDAPITVICSDLRRGTELKLGPLSDEDNPNFSDLYSYGDLDALYALNGHLWRVNPEQPVTLRRQPMATDLANHLVVLGGVAWNDVTRRLNEMFPLPVKQVQDVTTPTGEIFVVGDGSDKAERFLPSWQNDDPGTLEEPGVLVNDVGMLARLPNPYNSVRTLTYCNGIHSRGVLGAVLSLTDPAVRDYNEMYLEETFAGSDGFVVLMRVPVLGGTTVSPAFASPGVVLFSWPQSRDRRLGHL
jgi:transcriptional regulator with XRE-family HTH domain